MQGDVDPKILFGLEKVEGGRGERRGGERRNEASNK